MKKGQIYEGYVERVDFPNKGIVFVKENDNNETEKAGVKGTLPGQKVSFVVSKKRNGISQGRLVEVLEKSPLENCDKYCEHFGKCGGCSYLTMSYENQLKLKEEQVKRLLFDVTGEFTWEGIKAGPKQHRYRNKMEFTFGDEYKGGPLALGMHKKNSFHDIVSLNDCEIVDESINLIRNATLEYFTKVSENSSIRFYNRMSHEGQLRHLVVRRSETKGDIMINLVTTSEIKSDSEVMKGYVKAMVKLGEELEKRSERKSGEQLKVAGSRIVGILHTINDSVADVVQADELNVLYGNDYFYEEILGLQFKITPFSFFQTNTLGASVLYETARGYVGETKDKVIFDLYSGTGTIAQMLAPVAKKVVGVEIIEEAVESAKVNAKINGLDNCEFIAGDVLKVIDDVKDKPDFIVLDPPRDGINPKALSKIIAYGVDQIVYISCKPTSLARDLVVFKANGYEVVRGCCVDMFPGTGHVETIVLLSRQINMHKMKLNSTPFEMIKSGEKTIELRLYDEKRQQVKVGDRIVFTNNTTGETLNTTVTKLHRFNTFNELYKSLPLLKCGYTTENVDKATPSDMEQYYSVEEQRKYGVVGIELFRPKQITDETVACLQRVDM